MTKSKLFFNRLLVAIIVISTLILDYSCKDDDGNEIIETNDTIPLTGTWQVTSYDKDYDILYATSPEDSAKSFINMKYIYFNSDSTYYRMYKTECGFRKMYSDNFLVTDDFIDLNELSEYGFAIEDSVLTITSGSKTVLTFNKMAAEIYPEDYITSIDYDNSYDLSSLNLDLICDFAASSSDFWFIGDNSDDIQYRIGNPTSNGSVSLNQYQSLSVDFNYTLGIEIIGDYVWYGNESTIMRRPYYAATPTFESIYLTQYVGGFAYDGNHMWLTGVTGVTAMGEATDYTTFQLIEYDPENDIMIQTISLGSDIVISTFRNLGVAYGAEHLFICQDNLIQVCTTDPFEVISTYQISDIYNILGIAHDGTNLWIRVEYTDEYDSSNPEFLLQKELTSLVD